MKTKKNTDEKKTQKEKRKKKGPSGLSDDYAEELGPLLFLGRRSENGASWLSDAGEYCGDTGEDCDAGALLNCEYGGDFPKISQFCQNFAEFLLNFDQHFSGFFHVLKMK